MNDVAIPDLEPGIDHYAVMGNPVAHSRSPRIHHEFAQRAGHRLRYHAILVARGAFAEALKAFRDAGGKGLNVTVPFKRDAWQLARDGLTVRARRARAVNVLWFGPDGAVCGDNTDGAGLLRDLEYNLHVPPLNGCKLAILGAGGAVRGILPPLLDKRPAQVVIANRTPERAEKLAWSHAGDVPIRACSYHGLEEEATKGEFHLVIHATSLGLTGKLPPLPDGLLAAGAVCYDLSYGSEDTAFVRWGKRQGAAQSVDGLGMLVEQAAESFLLWRGIRPDSRTVLHRLREELQSLEAIEPGG